MPVCIYPETNVPCFRGAPTRSSPLGGGGGGGGPRKLPRKHATRCHVAPSLRVEALEGRDLPSGGGWPGLLNPVSQPVPTETLDQAQSLGNLSLTPVAAAVGSLGNGPAGAADVGWYSFKLTNPAFVTVTTLDSGVSGSLTSVLGLYNSDPFDFGDPYDVFHDRLLDQKVSTRGADAVLTRELGAGTYYVAVSGSGNQYFCPLMTGSGYAGSTGNYGLLLTAQDLGLDPTSNPVLLAADPVSGSGLARSPLVLRLDFSAPIDPTTINLGQNVTLTYNPTGAFGNGDDQAMALANFNFSTAVNELQLFPAAPLAPGFYQITVDTSVLARAASVTFQVRGIEGNPMPGATADDTLAVAHQLGDVTTAGLLHVAGVIGVDPTDPVAFNGSDVDLYHFRISGQGRYAFAGEVFAGRLGSPLEPALSLFALGSDGQLQLIAANSGTQNSTQTDNGAFSPLYTDPAIFAGLSAGDYYLAVTGNGTTFDPTQSHSGQGGWSTGPYVLNLMAQPSNQLAHVVATTPQARTVLSAPPTQFVVQFNEPVNLQQLAFQAYQQTQQSQISSVHIVGPGGNVYYPRLLAFDVQTDQATFQMLDALPNGSYQLHLSGSLGLTDFAGDPLVGNSPQGDYVVSFTVSGPPRGTRGNPLLWTYQPGSYNPQHIQDLGVLFPKELQSGVTIVRNAAMHTPLSDYYWFEVLQNQQYSFIVNSQNLPPGAELELVDSSGQPVPASLLADGISLLANLPPGRYGLGAELLGAAPAAWQYQISMHLEGSFDHPAPLTAGAAPVISFHLAGAAPVPAPAPALRIVVPPIVAVTNTTAVVSAVSFTAVADPEPMASNSALIGLASALGNGPLGGICSPSSGEFPAADRLLVRESSSPALQGLMIRMVVLTQGVDSGTELGQKAVEDALPAVQLLPSLASLIGDSALAFGRTCETALDLLFGVEKWLEMLHVPALGAKLSLEAVTPDASAPTPPLPHPWGQGGRGAPAVPEVRLDEPSDEVPTPTKTEVAWAGALLALGATALRQQRRLKKRTLELRS